MSERQDRTDCEHGEPVLWNPYNGVVQCHRCGEVFVPASEVREAVEILSGALP